VVHHGRFWLPASLRGKPSGNGEAARMLAEHYGVPVGFMEQAGGEADSAGAGEPTAMVPCVGDQLISGKVRWPSTNGFIDGRGGGLLRGKGTLHGEVSGGGAG